MKSAIEFCKNEWNSYTRKTKIALCVLLGLVALFAIFAIQILFWGLGYTDMNNVFAMGIWIIGDLGLVALGGGAFFSGFLLYIFRKDDLEPLINSTVLIGFMCYLFTFILLVFDIGQPLRAWFGYTYPNWGLHLMPKSMLTEVVWCLTLYFCVLCVELIPIPLKHKVVDKIPFFHYLGHYLHRLMWIMAAVGTFLSFFHQGSLGGGMWGVLYGKPGWFHPHFFFLAIVLATAGGTSFMTLWPYVASKIMKKEIVPMSSFQALAKVSGFMFIFYLSYRIFVVYTLSTVYVPMADRSFIDLLGGYYGLWMLSLELIFSAIPIVLLLVPKFREQEKFMVAGLISGVLAVLFHKLFVVLNGFSIPNFAWRPFMGYNPTIQEWFVMAGALACMALIYMCFAKYMPLVPHLHKHEHHEA